MLFTLELIKWLYLEKVPDYLALLLRCSEIITLTRARHVHGIVKKEKTKKTRIKRARVHRNVFEFFYRPSRRYVWCLRAAVDNEKKIVDYNRNHGALSSTQFSYEPISFHRILGHHRYIRFEQRVLLSKHRKHVNQINSTTSSPYGV